MPITSVVQEPARRSMAWDTLIRIPGRTSLSIKVAKLQMHSDVRGRVDNMLEGPSTEARYLTFGISYSRSHE